jgi:hypothetical protein
MSSGVPLIDRREERKRFKEILEQKAPRLVTIRDEAGNGKSRLLEEFRALCGWTIPASLTPVSIETVRSPFELVRLVVDGFGRDRFAGFNALDVQRIAKSFDAFAIGPGGAVHVGESISGNAAVAARIGVVAQAGSTVTVDGPAAVPQEWSLEHEEIARERCIRVFFDELHDLASDRAVVILLDEFEGCREDDVRNWIEGEFLRNVLTDERASALIVVIAGRQVPDLREQLGERHDDVVSVIPELSKWLREDIVEFLTEVIGRDPEPEAVDFVEMMLGRDDPIEKVVNVVKAYRA